MRCSNCGHENEAGARRCTKCGEPLGGMNPKEQGGSPLSAPSVRESDRGHLIFIFGALSILAVGPIIGIAAWVMGYRDLKKIRAGVIADSEKRLTKAGMILGIVGTFVSVPVIVLVVVPIFSGFQTGIDTFRFEAQKMNRDYLVRDLDSLASKAQRYYHAPKSAGGGGGSFSGFSLSARGDTITQNGSYQIAGNPPAVGFYIPTPGRKATRPDEIIIVGWGLERGKDGLHNVQAYVIVDSSIAKTTILN